MQNVINWKNWPVKWLCGRCLFVWGPEFHTPPPFTHCIRVYVQSTCSHREGGGESWSSEKVRGATVHKAGSRILTCLTGSPLLQSMNSEKLLPQSPLQVNYFRWRHFDLVILINPCFVSTLLEKDMRSSSSCPGNMSHLFELYFLFNSCRFHNHTHKKVAEIFGIN